MQVQFSFSFGLNFAGLMNLRREDYETGIPNQAFFCYLNRPEKRVVHPWRHARRQPSRFPCAAQKSEILRWKFLLGRLILNDPTAAKNSTADFVVCRHSVYAGRVTKSSRSPLHRAAAIHFIHFNEAAVINRGERNHYRIVMFGKKKFLARNCTSERTTISSLVHFNPLITTTILITTFQFALDPGSEA